MTYTAGTAGGGRLSTRPIRYVADGVGEGGSDGSAAGGDSVATADLAIAVDLVTACDVSVLGEADSGAGDVATMLASPTMDRGASFLAFDVDSGAPVGFTWVEADTTARDTFVDVFAPPGALARDVRDLGLGRGIEAARGHRSSAAEAGEWTVRCGAWLADQEYAAVITACGFVPVRRFYRMRIESTSPHVPEAEPPLPDGVEIVVCGDDEATLRRLCDVDNASFLDHWHFFPREFDEWWAYLSARSTRDPAGWWLLTVDGEDAAICLLDESRADLGDGYVGILGVRREFRGRGLAQLLLRRAFCYYRDLGRAGTQLGVDADSLTGAVRLYEKVGMQATRTVQGYALPLSDLPARTPLLLP